MSQEVHELHEHAHEAQENPELTPVTVTMAILAVLVAAASLLGHRAHTEELLLQSKATDQWAFFQAKSIRRHGYEQVVDLVGLLDTKDAEGARSLKEKYAKEMERTRDEQKEIETEAKSLEAETGLERRKADRFDLGEVLLEGALVITSMTLITRNRLFWTLGMLVAGVGSILAATGFLVH